MNRALPYRVRGLGDQQSAQLGVQIGGAGASAGAAAAVAAGLIPAAAVPFIGPAIAGAALLASWLIKNSGCGQTCIQTSSWANDAQAALKQNIDAYFSQPVRTRASQTLALQTYQRIEDKLFQLCGDPQWGDAGKRCISDRQAGACKWRATENSQWPGGLQLGQCFNWPAAFRDPIANDPNVIEDSIVAGLPASVSSLFQGGSSSGLPGWVIPAALLALVAVAL